MLTEVDEGRGLVKVYWSDIRARVAKVEPSFASIVDEINPDSSFPIFLAYYTYGELIGDNHSPLLPKVDGGYYTLFDPDAPKDVLQHLGYGKGSLPLGMILDKNFEFFIDLKDKGISIPWSVHSPGKFISFARNLSNKSRHIYAPNGILSTSSGSRSAFMLPNIGCIVLHSSLRRDFNVIDITSEREGEVTGTHTLELDAAGDRIVLTHEAKSRRTFAEGAVLAVEWIVGKTGFHDFKDIFGQL